MGNYLTGQWQTFAHAPKPGHVLCNQSDIEDPGVKEFRFGPENKAFSMIVARKGDMFYGYVNVCPHFQIPLNSPAVPEKFLCVNKQHLKCAHHMALFEVDTGLCIEGPPEKDLLIKIPLITKGDGVAIGD